MRAPHRGVHNTHTGSAERLTQAGGRLDKVRPPVAVRKARRATNQLRHGTPSKMSGPFAAVARRTCYEGRMPDVEEHQPGDRAPATAHYEELNVFGTPTGAVVHVRAGDRLPSAPRSFTWRRIFGSPE
jgi:hypothetical protein